MSRCDRREDGFSLVEVVITMAVMSIVATAVIAVAMRVFSDTATIGTGGTSSPTPGSRSTAWRSSSVRASRSTWLPATPDR